MGSSGAMKWLMAVLGFGAMTLAACGDDKTEKRPCTSDSQCAFGTICDGGYCTTLPCETSGDCLNGEQACVTVNAAQVCSAVECGCAMCTTCAVGLTCDNGRCMTPVACSDSAPCSGSDICDAGFCRACQGTECQTTADCTTTGCTGGQVCNPTTKACEAPSTTAEGCDVCETAADCGANWKCAALPSGKACLPPCTGASDCDTGWSCVSGSCTPDSYRCEGCVVDGCAAGQACNPETHACASGVAACGDCQEDWQCGSGSACNGGKCVKRCVNGACAAGGSCVAAPSGVQVCDTSCGTTCTPACSGTTPFCNAAGSCVGCRNNADCGSGQTCDGATGTCGNASSCTGTTPYLFQGQCVQCLENTHCTGGQTCSAATHTCTTGGSSAVCATCAAPYPACVTIGSDDYCVQCATDADCGVGGTCNLETYGCQGGTVGPATSCTQDSDCNAGTSGFSLVCHTGTGRCIDQGGMCDDVTAFCVGSDNKVERCISMLEAFMPGGSGGAPLPDLGGGNTIPGFCSCTYPIPGLPIGGNCRTGNCMDIQMVMELLSGGTGSGMTQPVCFDMGF